jgi:hypothetical protein
MFAERARHRDLTVEDARGLYAADDHASLDAMAHGLAGAFGGRGVAPRGAFESGVAAGTLGMPLVRRARLPHAPLEMVVEHVQVTTRDREATVTVAVPSPWDGFPLARDAIRPGTVRFPMKRDGGRWVFAVGPVEGLVGAEDGG